MTHSQLNKSRHHANESLDHGTQYVKTDDGFYGVIVRETRFEITVAIHGWNGVTRFSKMTMKQRGTPTRSFSWVESLMDVPDLN